MSSDVLAMKQGARRKKMKLGRFSSSKRRSSKGINPMTLSDDQIQQDGGKLEMSVDEVDRPTAKRPHSNLDLHEMLEVRPHAQCL